MREQANRVIGTVDGGSRLVARLAPAALSRFVDKLYHVPSLTEDWRRGGLEREQTDVAQRFIGAILEICEKEKIDVAFPSWDPHVCAFSQNKARFTERGIVVPVPEWTVLAKLIDKYSLMEQAALAGFPHPVTFLPRDETEALAVADRLGFPLVVKPRFSSGARGTGRVADRAELIASIRECLPMFGMPMLQEYVGGGNDGLINLIVVLDRDFRLRAFHSRRVIRGVSERFASPTTAEVCMHDPALAERAADLLRRVGYYGHAAFQLQRDPKDGIAKLLEINCRISYRVWCEIDIGLHIPRLALQVERGESLPAFDECRRDLLFVYPVEDRVGRLARWARAGRGGAADPAGAAGASQDGGRAGAREILRDWYFKSLWTDPLHAASWYGTRFRAIWQEMRRPAGSPL